MSKKPPKKKLRQTSLTDMFKSVDKESKVLDTPVTEHDPKEASSTIIECYDLCSNNSSDVTNDQIGCDITSTSDLTSSVAIAEVKLHIGSSSLMERSPPKSPMKKEMAGKFIKKKKYISGPNDGAGSSSRENDQKYKFNVSSKSKSDFKAKSHGQSQWASKESCELSPSKVTWRGTPLSSLQVLSNISPHVPTVHPSPDHTVMVKLPLPDSGVPKPHPSSYSDIWDQHHVRMPCSPKSLYPITAGSDSLTPRWSVICKVLRKEMKSVDDFQRNVLEYNSRYAAKWNFKGLHQLLEQEFEEEERDYFFEHTLPAIANLALDLPNLVTQAPPLLTQYSTCSITFSQIQIASLLANAFFCTFPRRNAKGGDTEYASYPDINFNRVFFHKEKRSMAKLKCLLNYFRRVTKKRPKGLVTFTRQYISMNDLPCWETSSHHLPDLHIDSSGLIEEKEGLLQVDFANKFIGGGVLGLGCVQEEIRFVLSPELIVSRLFTQVLDKTEALIITGAEQYNEASGYASTFCWAGSHQDTTKCDVWKRRLCQVVAIDALRFNHPKVQYRPPLVLRELNKVFAGYRALKGSEGTPIGVATGNWGCGAFNGNSRLKALIQLAACGYTGRTVAYFTFGDEKLRNDLSTMHIFLKENNVTVGELVQSLIQYGQREWADGSDLYHYIYHSLGAYDSDTDEEKEDDNGSPSKDEKTGNKFQKQPSHDSTSCKTTPKLKTSESPRKSASHSNRWASSDNNPGSSSSLQSSEVTREENLTEEKIVQVLKECDRLVEDQKKKNHENSSEIVEVSKDDQLHTESSVCRSQGAYMSSTGNTKKEIEHCSDKANKDLKEPVGLLASLDVIDKQAAFHK